MIRNSGFLLSTLSVLVLVSGCDAPLPSGLTEKSKGIRIGMSLAEVEKALEPVDSDADLRHLGSLEPKPASKQRWDIRISGMTVFDGEEERHTGTMEWIGRAQDNESGVILKLTFKEGKVTDKAIVTEEAPSNPMMK